ncbi:hypothetical protein Msi02_26130 [Microbispora siamensis]|uniref:Uncharacterized protein n=1 Tax=Microbispora siamensis TaxID=564413 RepID=A0ABQ4GK31_9ACTN|nr:hypothetical protein Msi02_26130 [Microbispora siamensis]
MASRRGARTIARTLVSRGSCARERDISVRAFLFLTRRSLSLVRFRRDVRLIPGLELRSCGRGPSGDQLSSTARETRR